MSTSPVTWQKNPALAWREIDDEPYHLRYSVMHELTTPEFLWRTLTAKIRGGAGRTPAELPVTQTWRYPTPRLF